MNSQEIIITYQKVYDMFDIFPFLQLHQLRVAKVVKQICSQLSVDINTDLVIACALLHDMGNIVKINFNSPLAKQALRFSEHDVKYWETIKQNHINNFGEFAHIATTNILKKLTVDKEILDLVNFSSWQNIQEIIDGDNFEAKVLVYSDYRVVPDGVSSLDTRLSDLRRRYSTKAEWDDSEFEKTHNTYHILEKQLIEKGLIPKNITDDSIASINFDDISLKSEKKEDKEETNSKEKTETEESKESKVKEILNNEIIESNKSESETKEVKVEEEVKKENK